MAGSKGAEGTQAWYDAFRDSQNTRVADQTYARNIVSAVFVEWYHQALRKRTAEDRLVLLLHRQGRDAVQRAFDVWSRRTQMVALEATVAQNSERRLLRRHWEQWRVTRCAHPAVDLDEGLLTLSSYHNRQADAFRRLTLLSTVLRRWQARMKRLRVRTSSSAIERGWLNDAGFGGQVRHSCQATRYAYSAASLRAVDNQGTRRAPPSCSGAKGVAGNPHSMAPSAARQPRDGRSV